MQMMDVVERIRNLSMAVNMTGCSNESEQKVSDEIATLRAKNERLLKENFSLSAWQCEFVDGKTGLVAHEHGGTYCAMAKENERLKAALQDVYMTTRCDKTAAKARTALGFTPVPNGQPARGRR